VAVGRSTSNVARPEPSGLSATKPSGVFPSPKPEPSHAGLENRRTSTNRCAAVGVGGEARDPDLVEIYRCGRGGSDVNSRPAVARDRVPLEEWIDDLADVDAGAPDNLDSVVAVAHTGGADAVGADKTAAHPGEVGAADEDAVALEFFDGQARSHRARLRSPRC